MRWRPQTPPQTCLRAKRPTASLSSNTPLYAACLVNVLERYTSPVNVYISNLYLSIHIFALRNTSQGDWSGVESFAANSKSVRGISAARRLDKESICRLKWRMIESDRMQIYILKSGRLHRVSPSLSLSIVFVSLRECVRMAWIYNA